VKFRLRISSAKKDFREVLAPGPRETQAIAELPMPLDAKSGRRYYWFMKIRLIVEKDPKTGRYSSVFPELPGCASAGDTEDEAIANAQEALELWFEW
jgi:hypothetical protein